MRTERPRGDLIRELHSLGTGRSYKPFIERKRLDRQSNSECKFQHKRPSAVAPGQYGKVQAGHYVGHSETEH